MTILDVIRLVRAGFFCRAVTTIRYDIEHGL